MLELMRTEASNDSRSIDIDSWHEIPFKSAESTTTNALAYAASCCFVERAETSQAARTSLQEPIHGAFSVDFWGKMSRMQKGKTPHVALLLLTVSQLEQNWGPQFQKKWTFMEHILIGRANTLGR